MQWWERKKERLSHPKSNAQQVAKGWGDGGGEEVGQPPAGGCGRPRRGHTVTLGLRYPKISATSLITNAAPLKKILGPRQIRLSAVQIEFAQPPKSTTKAPHTANYSAGLWHDVSFKGLSPSVHSTAFTANGMSKWRGPICLEGRGTTTSLFSYSHPIQPSIN